jgi:hypothetical protein
VAVSDAKKDLFLTITRAMEDYDDWFKLRKSASREISASPVMKCVAAVRVVFISKILIYFN